MLIRRFLLALLALLTAALLTTLSASADTSVAGGANQLVQVSTSGVGDTRSRSGIQVAPFGGQVSGSTNIAIATSTECTDCRTVAVAYQAIFVTNNPRVVVPGNAAVAVNAACTRCQTYAFAYQYELSTDGPTYLSPAGRLLLNALREEASDLAASDLPLPELDAKLIAIKGRFKALIDSELIAAGKLANGAEDLKIERAPDA